MTVTITLGGVDMAPYVDWDGIRVPKSKKIVENTYPGTDTSTFQNMGSNSNEWQMEGLISRTTAGDADKATLEGFYDDNDTESFVYNGTRNVIITAFEAKDNVTFWSFTMTLREV